MIEKETFRYELVDEAHNSYKCEKCGHIEQFEADGPYENGWSYCPHCGNLISNQEGRVMIPLVTICKNRAEWLEALPDDESQEKALHVNPCYAMLATAIPYGRRNAITRQALAAKLGMNDRTARKAIEEARAAGLLIMCEQNGRGYYQSDDPVEMRCQYQQDTNRAMSILKRRKPLLDALRAAGQRV